MTVVKLTYLWKKGRPSGRNLKRKRDIKITEGCVKSVIIMNENLVFCLQPHDYEGSHYKTLLYCHNFVKCH